MLNLKKIAVLGGGNGAHAIAADLALKGFEINICEDPEFAEGFGTTIRRKEVDLVDVRGEKRTAKLKEEIEKGKKYTAQILTNEEYQTSTSGLIYKIEKQGNTGTNLSKTPSLQMNYIASKISGKQYESTMNGDPRIIHKNGLLKAWLEAFKIAGKGGIIEVIAPPSLT